MKNVARFLKSLFFARLARSFAHTFAPKRLSKPRKLLYIQDPQKSSLYAFIFLQRKKRLFNNRSQHRNVARSHAPSLPLKTKQPTPPFPKRINNKRAQKQPNRNPNRNLNNRITNIKRRTTRNIRIRTSRTRRVTDDLIRTRQAAE